MKKITLKLWTHVWFLLFFLFTISASSAQSDYDYSEVLSRSIEFYDAQICGPQPSWSRAEWRLDCHLNDGQDIGKNLTGGWHDAGDHTKFNYVSAQATRVLAWSYLEYQKSFDDTGNKTDLLRHLRLSGDFMMKLHPSPNVFYAQIGRAKTGPNPEHNEWVPPSQQSARIDRNVTTIDTNNPGTHMAAANAAAFASLSMVFENEDPEYSDDLLQHAIDLYNFGESNLGDHYDLLSGEPYPTQDTYDGDLLVGAIWLYKATGQQQWLDKAKTYFSAVEFNVGWTMHYRDHQFESFLLLSQILGEQRYYDAAERWIDGEIDGAPRTDAGLYFRSDFLAASFAQAMAFGAYYYADLRGNAFSKSTEYKNFAFRQLDYVLGDNPRNSSYVSGFGNNFPKRIHHRGASGVAQNAQVDDMHELTGALVGGPFQDDSWSNDRTDVKRTEPAISNQAFFVGMTAMKLKEDGTEPPSQTEGTIEIENNFSVVNETGSNNTVGVDATNPGASNGRYVRLFDTNDELSTSFSVGEAGDYQLDLRVRTGEESAKSTSNLASQYEIRIDGTVRNFSFVSGSASALDGDTYWGDLTRTQNLSAGSHTVRIKAKANWLKADRLKFEKTADQNLSDEIVSINAPGSVTQGQTARVTVDYSASMNRDIVAMLQYDGTPNFQTFKAVRRDVTAGTGTLNIDIPVPSDLPVGNDLYQIQVYIAPDGGNFNNRFNNIRRNNIDGIASAPDNANTILVRAKGVSGDEIFELLVNDGRFGDLKKVSTEYVNYIFEDVPSGTKNIKVKYVNDGPGLDMQVDYIKIGNSTIQAENQSVNTSVWQNGSCGGSNSEIMNCNGEIRFGNRNIGGSTALTASLTVDVPEITSEMAIYPNPATGGRITIAGPRAYDLEVTDLSGRKVLVKKDVSSTEQLDVVDLPTGMYIFRTIDRQTGKDETRKVIIR